MAVQSGRAIIAKALRPDQIASLEAIKVSRRDILKLAMIADAVTRNRAVALSADGVQVDHAIAFVLSTPAAAVNAKVAEDELAPEQWLETCCGSLRVTLQDTRKYDEEALLFRNTRVFRSVFRGRCQNLVLAHKDNGYSPFLSLASRIMFLAHPNDWSLCGTCEGENVTNPACPSCGGDGYTLRYEMPRPKTA